MSARLNVTLRAPGESEADAHARLDAYRRAASLASVDAGVPVPVTEWARGVLDAAARKATRKVRP